MSQKELEGRAASRRAPILNSIGGSPMGGTQTVFRIQCPVTSTAFPIPVRGRGAYVSFLVYSGSIDANGVFQGPYAQVGLSVAGGPAPNLVLNQTVDFTSTGSMQSGATCLNGVAQEWYVPFATLSASYSNTSSVVTSVQAVVSASVICSGTGGFFEVYVSDLA